MSFLSHDIDAIFWDGYRALPAKTSRRVAATAKTSVLERAADAPGKVRADGLAAGRAKPLLGRLEPRLETVSA